MRELHAEVAEKQDHVGMKAKSTAEDFALTRARICTQGIYKLPRAPRKFTRLPVRELRPRGPRASRGNESTALSGFINSGAPRHNAGGTLTNVNKIELAAVVVALMRISASGRKAVEEKSSVDGGQTDIYFLSERRRAKSRPTINASNRNSDERTGSESGGDRRPIKQRSNELRNKLILPIENEVSPRESSNGERDKSARRDNGILLFLPDYISYEIGVPSHKMSDQ